MLIIGFRQAGRMDLLATLAANSTFLVAAGTILTLIGTVVRVVPDLRRRVRRPFYRHFWPTRHLFQQRSKYKNITGQNFETKDSQVIQEILDYVQELHTPNTYDLRTPKRVEATATLLYLYFDNEHSDDEPDETINMGRPVEWVVPEILTSAIETKCRNWGLGIAIVGGILGVVGLFLS